MSAIPLGAKVVANWQPSVLDAVVVRREWVALARKLCGSGRVLFDRTTTRGPHHSFAGGVKRWHRDARRGDVYLLLWSNHLPTMVRSVTGHRLKAKRGDVLLLDNKMVTHRTDKRVRKGGSRWWARVIIPKGEK